MTRMELHAEITINAPAAAVWATIGEQFGDIARWAAPISGSSIDGLPAINAVRSCQIGDIGPIKAGVIKERLRVFDPQAMHFEYEGASGMPGFIERAINRWSVQAIDANSCTVRTYATVQLRGPMRLLAPLMRSQFLRDGQKVLEELKHWMETGTPHPRKQNVVTTKMSI